MAHAHMVEVYVRELLLNAFGEGVGIAEHGYLVPMPGAPMVQVLDSELPALRARVFAIAASDIPTSPGLLGALNDLNAVVPYGRLYLDDGTVVVEDTLWGDTLCWAQLKTSLDFVSWAAEHHGRQLARRFGGSAPAEQQPTLPGVGTESDALELPPTSPVTGEYEGEGAPLVDAPIGVNAAGYL